jgi:predicted Ser/Thr protein kinase
MDNRSNDPTLPAPDTAPHPRLPYAQFAPGSSVAGRYRVVSLLGSGGMGEVYRADDMKLGQQVALKFLPAAFAHDLAQLDLLHEEVRLGRQVAHPNVCRVYDIGEFDGAHFVAMEYVDGEDLGRLLRRIGRLAHDKAVEIARGLAAGLAAAHAKGILHRDLKPANIMIDGRGEPRITDFGLAMTSEESAESKIVAGTPSYMAPEQLEGKPASVQSDLYALGLVLYEIFTGRRARTGRTVPDLRREHTTDVTTPSSIVRDIDPAVERIILRCLETDPADRPRSARQLFEALPGGDPLAAALAAGETPSPRLVAAAGIEGTLRPAVAWMWVGIIVALLVCLIGIGSDWRIMSKVSFDKSADVLEADAIAAGRALGIEPAPFRVTGFEADTRYLAWLTENDKTRSRFEHLRSGPPVVLFWVRESAQPLTPLSNETRATQTDPPAHAGIATIEVDTTGKLFALTAPPPRNRTGSADWNKLLHLAGFDGAALTRVPPRETPPYFADQRAAWNGVWPDDRSKPVHIEAAAAGGVPVFLYISGPWSGDLAALQRQPFWNRGLEISVAILVAALTLFTIILAFRNLRLRRGDRSGAMRIAFVIFFIECAVRLLRADHRAVFGHELSVIVSTCGVALFWAAIYFFLYIALEPYVRRRWPERLVGWSRLLAGNLRDPLVGRDMLVGIAAGLGHATLASVSSWLPGRLGLTLPGMENTRHTEALLGLRYTIAMIASWISNGIITGLLLVVFLVGLVIVLRRRSVAIAALYLLQLAIFAVASNGNPYVFGASVLIAAIWTAVTVRVGLLGISTAQTIFNITFFLTLAIDAPSWMLPSTLAPILFIVILTAFAFRTALGGQPMFSTRLLDE